MELPTYLNSKFCKYYNENGAGCVVTTKVSTTIVNGNEYIINLEKVNNIRRINKFHESINSKLKNNGIYVSCGETLLERKIRVRAKSPYGLKTIVRIIDFIYKRVFPKLPIFKYVYFEITKGHNRVMSKAEMLGRLISCGFEILEYFEHQNLFYIITRKKGEPKFNLEPSYGPLFKMERVGYRGKIIKVYKIRSMYPYSEYCQELIINENKLDKSGKIYNDFRVTTWGRILRKLWIDELPMFLNYFKGELNLVGVRPLSKNYFLKYPQELQNLRVQVKPGLIPPYYADMPKNFQQILESEKRYLLQKLKAPFKTDVKYLYKAIINIVFKGARSQ